MSLSELPPVAEQLQKNIPQAIRHLLPDGQLYDDGFVYYQNLRVNQETGVWYDKDSQTAGAIHDLWANVKRRPVAEIWDDVEYWLTHVNTPQFMRRFCFSPAEMDDRDGFNGEYVEVFPDVRFYAGTTTLLAGYNGSGKSTLATQIANQMAHFGMKSFILSPEMPPNQTAHIIQRQSTNISDPTPQEWTAAGKHLQEHFLISTTEDRIDPAGVISQFDQAYEYGCRVFVLDSVTCVRTGHELYQQADFADMLRNWSRCHPEAYLLVIAHMRKPSGYIGGQLSRYDIRGAGEISDLAGHVWLLQRKNPFDQKEMAHFGEHDARLIVDKNRATGKLVCKMLRFANIQKLFHSYKQPPCYLRREDNVHTLR